MNASTRLPRGATRPLAVGVFLLALGSLASVGPARATTTPSPAATPAATTGSAASADAATRVGTIGGARLAEDGIITDLPAGTPAPPEMHDGGWLVADLDTGEVIAAKAPHARFAPASTLKTLAALVLLPRIDPRRSYVAQDGDTLADGTRIGLVPGQLYTGKQLFEALLMGSANDAAYMLSRINGGIPATLTEMNAEADELGALDTHAGDPSGLDTPGQVSSAYDLALFGAAAIQVDAFRTYDTTLTVPFPGNPVPSGTATATGSTSATTRSPVFVDAAGVKRQTYALSNHNTLLFNYPGVIGGKNGYTGGALRTYISIAQRGGHTYIATEMEGTDLGEWRPTARLLDWAFANGAHARPVGRLVKPGEVQAARAAATPALTAGHGGGNAATPPAGPHPSAGAAFGLAVSGNGRDLATMGVGATSLFAAFLLGAVGARRASRRKAYVPRRARRPRAYAARH